MQITHIKETCLYSSLLEETLDFYTKALDLKVYDYQPGKHLFLIAGNSMLLFFNPEDSRKKDTPPPHFGSGKMHVAFEVTQDEYESAKKHILENEIDIIHEETWSNGTHSFYFNDPNGHVLEIVTPGLWD